MARWDALWDVMGTRRRNRIGLSEADRLAAGEPTAAEHAGLGTLLSAAAAPPFAQELAGERAAVAGFAQAYGSGASSANRRRAGLAWSRAAAVKAAVGLAVAVSGGTAFAAANGNLPAGVQQQAHHLFSSLGVPAPQTDTPPTTTGTGTPAAPRPTPTAGASRSTDPGPAAALGLCHAWDAERKNPHGKAMSPEVRRALAAAAGGEQNIPEFCARLLGGQDGHGSPSAAPTPQSGATPGRSHPGNGNGGNGNGNGGNGADHSARQSHPTRSPHP